MRTHHCLGSCRENLVGFSPFALIHFLGVILGTVNKKATNANKPGRHSTHLTTLKKLCFCSPSYYHFLLKRDLNIIWAFLAKCKNISIIEIWKLLKSRIEYLHLENLQKICRKQQKTLEKDQNKLDKHLFKKKATFCSWSVTFLLR